jgi:hypothetical protein
MENPVTSSKIERVTIKPRYKSDKEKTENLDLAEIDLTPYVAELHYYETILSPNTTATITIINQNPKVKLLEDVVILGGEEVTFTVKDFVSINNKDKNAGLVKIKMYVEVPDNRQSTKSAEVFRLKLESSWKETLENVGKIKGTRTGSPSQIANEVFKANFNRNIDHLDSSTSVANINFGDEKKDDTFPAIMRLASEAAYNKSAGFFFYQTKFGHHFKSIDKLIAEAKGGTNSAIDRKPYEYQYNGINPGINEADISSRTIVNITKRTNNWIAKNQMRADASRPVNPIATDPITYNWYGTGPTFYENNFETFDLGTVKVTDGAEFSKNAWGATKLENYGLLNRFDTVTNICDFSNNPFQTKAVAKARYTSLFGEMVNITVPCNTSIIAGSSVKLDIKKVNEGPECSFEDSIVRSDDAGLYIVAAVCHAFNRQRAYSSVFLVRDQKKKEGI